MKHVLVVDDEIGMRAALEANFRKHGWRVRTADGVTQAIELFRSEPTPLVVTDVHMPDGNGLTIMQKVREISPRTRVIILTAFGNIPEAVSAMRDGACNYLIKPVGFDQLLETAEHALGLNSPESAPAAESPVVGDSPRFRTMLERARQAAQNDADILVEAESGTGKEVLARFIHQSSPRRNGAFVAVNCAAFPETLLESELFGHVRGAFTGALATKRGKFEMANGGTLLLDEIGEMPLNLQPKLLRVLQERVVDRLGDTHTVPVDVRVIATTNRSLVELVKEGKFRMDLYYRLNVIPLTIPPLRERRQDLPALVDYFIRKYAAKSGIGPVRATPEFLDRIATHDWPGNVRELENFVRRMLALYPGPALGTEVLEEIEFAGRQPASCQLEAGLTLRDAERELLRRTLEATGGNRTRSAEMLGVSLRTIRNKIREYGLPARREFT
jgi:DNA-binding NtrC family response regulator